jgi:hypothetical protein
MPVVLPEKLSKNRGLQKDFESFRKKDLRDEVVTAIRTADALAENAKDKDQLDIVRLGVLAKILVLFEEAPEMTGDDFAHDYYRATGWATSLDIFHKNRIRAST